MNNTHINLSTDKVRAARMGEFEKTLNWLDLPVDIFRPVI